MVITFMDTPEPIRIDPNGDTQPPLVGLRDFSQRLSRWLRVREKGEASPIDRSKVMIRPLTETERRQRQERLQKASVPKRHPATWRSWDSLRRQEGAAQ